MHREKLMRKNSGYRLPSLSSCRLKAYATHGTGHRAKITRHASFSAIRVTRQDYTPSPSRRQIGLFLRILNSDSPLKRMQQNTPQSPHYTEHSNPFLTTGKQNSAGYYYIQQRQRQHQLPAKRHKLVISRTRQRCPKQNEQANNSKCFYRKPHNTGGSHGPSHPPRKKAVTSADISVIPRYSPTKNIANFIPEYSL